MIRRAAVIGTPIAHSRSPAIFRFVAERVGRHALEYSARAVQPEALTAFLEEVRQDATFVGFNVTLPHKEVVLAHLDTLSEEARVIGAVNVVQRTAAGLHGLNTDVVGIERTLEGHDLRGRDALILGAGGAARAVAWVLRERGARTVFVWSRRASAARALAASFETSRTTFVATLAWSDLPPLALVVQATPAGMKGVVTDPELFTPLRGLALAPGALAFDLVYTPPNTPFLRAARARGMRAVGGLPMLVDQALATWARWFEPAEPEVRGALLERLGPPVFLTGFMGAGKSTIGARLAAALGTQHIDLDRAIEAGAGLTIPEIFERSGEADFRRREREALAQLAETRAVISLGGGALLDPESRALVERAGVQVYLAATAETLEARLGDAVDRPLLAGLDTGGRRAKIAAMLALREPDYRSADFTVDTDGLTPALITDRAVELLR